MDIQLKDRLDAMIGKTFAYQDKNIKITKYKDVGGTNVVIFIDGRPRNFFNNEVPAFLNELYEPLPEPLKGNQIAIPKKELSVYEPTAENQEVKATLLDTLKKVKDDPDYIPQAQAICGVVNQIVQVQKTEIQMLNIIKKTK